MEEKKRLEVNKVNYKRLYFDFISEQDDLSVYEKLMLTRHINTYFNTSFSFKQLYKINDLIRKSLKRMDYKAKIKSVNAYDKSYILEILSYQKEFRLSDSAVSSEFKLSRNTLASWKKRFDNF
ncbi:MAG: hypothetical protein ACPGSD_17595 [Flavobacteriales bacterium]|jgi:hypothetical protein